MTAVSDHEQSSMNKYAVPIDLVGQRGCLRSLCAIPELGGIH